MTDPTLSDKLVEHIIVPSIIGLVALAWWIVRKTGAYTLFEQRDLKARMAEKASREELTEAVRDMKAETSKIIDNLNTSFDRIRAGIRDDYANCQARIDNTNQRIDKIVENGERRNGGPRNI